MRHFLLIAAIVLSGIFATSAQAGEAEDHQALRQLKDHLAQAVSNRDFEAAQKVLHQPFMSTVITQESFTDLPQLKNYFDSLFTRDFLRIKALSIKPEADELSRIYTGTIALTRGSTAERYEMADGRSFDLKGRWTAVSVKESDGAWRLMAFHSGVNFLDNPVLAGVEKSALWVGLAGAAIGLLLGFWAGWLLRRQRTSRSAE